MSKEIPEPKSLEQMATESREGSAYGILCPHCKCVQFRDGMSVRNTRKVHGGVKRYRTCRNCGHSWTTYER